MKTVYLIHENRNWSEPLEDALNKIGVPYVDWYMVDRLINMTTSPPGGIFYNRMSASAHSRGHRYCPELTTGLLAWLESNNRRVINGSSALRLELSKMVQYSTLREVGIKFPRTVAATNAKGILEAAQFLKYPIISKPNRAGKGLGVKLSYNENELKNYVLGDDFESSIDGITLVQEYIEAPDTSITRVEFVDQKFLYALRVDTSNGFELCPADSCEIAVSDQPINKMPYFKNNIGPKFNIIAGFSTLPLGQRLIPCMTKLMKRVGMEVASFEFIIDKNSNPFVYDINVNTNYNNSVEERSELSGFSAVANFLQKVSKY